MKNWLILFLRTSSPVIGAMVFLGGCASKGPGQRAGESIDRGVQNVKDAVDPAGPGEKMGRAVDRTVNP